ncbi:MULTISPECIES: AAA domain-containing protein [Microbacterium]|uniref:AAA domain-containing protein n=1 Tax=Microbacterium TaxID=33882 RepID=UPI0027D918A2|nr:MULTISPECIES: AAA domain-containing protein [Microbacterium]
MGQPEIIAGQYVILPDQKARTGGSGSVYKAVDLKSGGSVAVKFVSGADHLVQKLHEREVELLRRAAHPNIVEYVDHGVDDTGTRFVVLKWIEQNLQDVIDVDPPMSWSDFRREVLRPLAQVIKHLHVLQVEHRDLKPSNVLWDASARPVLADFGIAKQERAVDDTSLTVGQAGTPLYAPPELSRGPRYVRDVYSLGVLAIQALTPVEQRAKSLHELLPCLDALQLPDAVDRLLRASISITPLDRPRNGAEFARMLDEAIDAEAPRPRNTTVVLRLTRRAQEHLGDPSLTKEAAERLVETDLASVTYASLHLNPETQAYDPTVFVLCGDSMRLKVGLDSGANQLVIISIRLPEYEDLERQRESSLRLDSLFAWTLRPPLNPVAAVRGQRDLLQRLLDFHENADESSTLEEALANQMLGVWRRLLTARETMGVSKLGSQDYRALVDRGRAETRFEMLVPIDEDLIGSEWKIVDERSRTRARGVAVQQSDDELTIRWVRRDDRELPGRGTLTPYLGPTQVALDRQRDAIQRLESGNVALPELLSVLADPSESKTPAEIDEPRWISEIDESKRHAVRAALGSRDCTVVSGPPGTGKTRMIAELVGQELERRPNSRILLVSQTHVALDNAIQRLEEIGVTGVVRMGRDDDRVADGSKKLLLDVQLRTWAAGVRSRAEAELATQASAAGLTAQQLRAAVHLQDWLAARDATEYLLQRLTDAHVTEDTTASRMELVDDPESIQEKVTLAQAREESLLRAAREDLGDGLEIDQSASAEDVRAAIDLILGQSPEASRLVELMKLQSEWLQRVASDDRLASVYLANSRVVAGTCLGFIAHRAARDLTYDLCIVDEASKATSTEVLVPLVRARKFMLVGDTNQLPPLDEDLLREPGILRDSDLTPEMVRETLFDRLVRHLPESNHVTLRRQYRMVPAIGNLISSCFYEGALESEPKELPNGAHLLGKPVTWITTSSSPERFETRDVRGPGSFVNHFEAQLVMERLTLLEDAVKRGVLVPSRRGNYRLLVVAPYRSQIDELERRISRMRGRFVHLDIEVESVDAVQGRECDFAIFSVTRSNTDGRLGFLGESYWRRINVALSRARYGLTVVGDAQFCEMSPGGLKKVVEYVRANPDDCEMRG